MARYFNIIDALEALEELLNRKLCCIAEAVGGADQDDDVPSLQSIQETIEAKGHTWGASDTLPEAKKPIHGRFTAVDPNLTLVIPASLWYSVYLVSDGTITEYNGSTLTTDGEGDGEFVAPSRVDGQAYPSVTYTVPNGLVVNYSYLPL